MLICGVNVSFKGELAGYESLRHIMSNAKINEFVKQIKTKIIYCQHLR